MFFRGEGEGARRERTTTRRGAHRRPWQPASNEAARSPHSGRDAPARVGRREAPEAARPKEGRRPGRSATGRPLTFDLATAQASRPQALSRARDRSLTAPPGVNGFLSEIARTEVGLLVRGSGTVHDPWRTLAESGAWRQGDTAVSRVRCRTALDLRRGEPSYWLESAGGNRLWCQRPEGRPVAKAIIHSFSKLFKLHIRAPRSIGI
jgi:hypothetical protein